MNLSLKKGLISGFYWSLIGQVGYMLIALISNVILVRLLSTKEFGQVGIIMFFILLAKVLTESGFSGALVRKKNATHKDFTTVFIFNLIVSLLLFLFFVFISDYVADFYRDPALKNILIVSSFVLIINAFQITHNAKLVKNLEFKKKSIYSFISILIASIVAVILAFNGAGVWSIVAMQLLTAFILTLLLWVYEGSVGKIIFSKTSFKELFKFGIYTTLASVLNTIFENVYQLVLGKYFSINQTGLFYQAKKIQEIPVGIIKSTTLGVVFSSLSKVQEDLNSFNSLYKKIITVFTALVGFICVFVFFYAENIILLLYGEKWIGAIFFIQVLIIASFFYMQEMI
jgi:teichuronic acid exporter